MNSILILPIALLIGILLWIILFLVKKQSGIKIMLLGIAIILTGGVIAVDPNSNLGGIEYLLVLAGLIISVLGFSKDDKVPY